MQELKWLHRLLPFVVQVRVYLFLPFVCHLFPRSYLTVSDRALHLPRTNTTWAAQLCSITSGLLLSVLSDVTDNTINLLITGWHSSSNEQETFNNKTPSRFFHSHIFPRPRSRHGSTYPACRARPCSFWTAAPAPRSPSPRSSALGPCTPSGASGCTPCRTWTTCSRTSTCHPLRWGKDMRH